MNWQHSVPGWGPLWHVPMEGYCIWQLSPFMWLRPLHCSLRALNDPEIPVKWRAHTASNKAITQEFSFWLPWQPCKGWRLRRVVAGSPFGGEHVAPSMAWSSAGRRAFGHTVNDSTSWPIVIIGLAVTWDSSALGVAYWCLGEPWARGCQPGTLLLSRKHSGRTYFSLLGS